MGSVRNPTAAAWVAQVSLSRGDSGPLLRFARIRARRARITSGTPLGVTVWDLFYVGLTIVVFAVLLLILKGIETFER
jgi:hypothetical protein